MMHWIVVDVYNKLRKVVVIFHLFALKIGNEKTSLPVKHFIICLYMRIKQIGKLLADSIGKITCVFKTLVVWFLFQLPKEIDDIMFCSNLHC